MNQEELKNHLSEQLYFLESDLNSTNEKEFLAKRTATTIRTLVHDTQSSNSLLNQLNLKGISFYNSSAGKDDISFWRGNFGINGWGISTLPFIGIVGKDVLVESNNVTVKYFPIYKQWNQLNYFKTIDFEAWWNGIIYDNRMGVTLSRKNLILNVSNKDGGAHIDELRVEYISFKTADVFKYVYNGQIQGTDNMPVYPAVLQIAWELYNSIKKELGN